MSLVQLRVAKTKRPRGAAPASQSRPPKPPRNTPSRRYALKVLNPPAFPEQIRLENTNLCNAACKICPRELLTRRQGLIDVGLVDRIIANCKGHKITKFTVQGFGEPLLDPNYAQHIRKINKELGCRTFTVTNASRISLKLAREIIDSGLNKVKISFYGTNKEEYEKVHIRLKYERTLESIMNLVRAKREARSDLIICVQYIGSVRKFIPFFFRWFRKARVGFNTLHNYGDGRKYNSINGKKAKGCPMLTQPILQVLWTGQVVPCCYDFNGTMILGDLNHQTIEEVWHGGPYRRLRRAHATADFRGYPVCANCDKRF